MEAFEELCLSFLYGASRKELKLNGEKYFSSTDAEDSEYFQDVDSILAVFDSSERLLERIEIFVLIMEDFDDWSYALESKF